MNSEGSAGFDTGDGGSSGRRGVPSLPNGDGKTAVEFERELQDWAERLGCPVVDDGSLESRLHDEPGLADAMLGREPLHPAALPAEAEFPVAAARLAEAIDQAISVSQAPFAAATARGLDLAGTIDLLVELQQRLNALQTAHGLLLEQARRAGFREEASFIDDKRMARIGDRSKRQELVDRAVIADIAMALHDSHDDVGKRMAQGQSLVARAPQTLTASVSGKVAWRNAAFLADQVADLAPSVAARVDAAAAQSASTAAPAVFRRRVRKIVEDVHPTPMAVRHANAACKRNVRTDLAADGMGYLTLFAPVTAINAIWDRLSRTAKRVRYGTSQSQPSTADKTAAVDGASVAADRREVLDGRTLDQLRADAAIALLLDDGTLDLAAATYANLGAASGRLSSGRTATASVETPSEGGSESGSQCGDPDDDDDSDDDCDLRVCGPHESALLAVDSPFSLAKIARSIRPKVFVTIPVLTLLDAVDEPALLDGTIPIDPDTARELAGLATSFTRILTDRYHGQVLGVDAKNYRPPADLQQWVRLRDGTCRFPGCTRRSVEADIDHNAEWSGGGATTANNLNALCRRHHTLKTVGAFTATVENVGQDREPGGAMPVTANAPILWTSPSGRQATTTAEPVPTTIHRPGSRLPHGPTPETEEPEFGDLDDPPF